MCTEPDLTNLWSPRVKSNQIYNKSYQSLPSIVTIRRSSHFSSGDPIRHDVSFLFPCTATTTTSTAITSNGYSLARKIIQLFIKLIFCSCGCATTHSQAHTHISSSFVCRPSAGIGHAPQRLILIHNWQHVKMSEFHIFHSISFSLFILVPSPTRCYSIYCIIFHRWANNIYSTSKTHIRIQSDYLFTILFSDGISNLATLQIQLLRVRFGLYSKYEDIQNGAATKLKYIYQ